MKKNNIFLILFLCLALFGCQGSNKNAEEEYRDVLERMNKDIYYYKTEVSNYLHENLAYTIKGESLRKDTDVYIISYFVLQPDDKRTSVLEKET